MNRRPHNEVEEMFGRNDIEMAELPRLVEPDIPRPPPDADGFWEIDLHAAEGPLVNRNYQEFYNALEEGQNLVQQQQDIQLVGAEIHSSRC